MQFSSKDIQLFNEAGINVEDKNYTNDKYSNIERVYSWDEIYLKIKNIVEEN